MNKRTRTVLLTALLGLTLPASTFAQTSATAAVQTTTLQEPAAAPADARLQTAPVSLAIGRYQGPLSSLLAALAKSAGYDVLFEQNVDALPGSAAAGASGTNPVVYNFHDTPFNQVWPLLMDVYGLSYDLLSVGTTPVLRVKTTPGQDVIALSNASAADAVNQIKLFFGTPTYTETPIKDPQGNVTGVTRTLTDVKLDSPTLRIVPDVRANTLIVRGTSRELAEVRRLAEQFDKQVRVAAAPAPVVAETVQQVYTVKGQQADILAVLTAQYPALKVTPVGTTGQLILQGPRPTIDAAVNLVSSVDRPAPVVTVSLPGVVQKVFALQNAQASNVKRVLDNALARQLITQTGSAAAPAGATVSLNNPDGTVTTVPNLAAAPSAPAVPAAQGGDTAATIIADDRTNTLVVRGSQSQVNQIAELIPAFDQRVPQVNLQVRIQEVSETATRALGIDWKAGFGSFVVNLASSAVRAIFDPTRALAGFNLGATLDTLENQGMTKRVYDGAVTMQSGQKALDGGGSVSNASSGAAAHVQSGGRIELNIPAGAGVAPIQRQIDYGVTLDFYSPQVAPDGTITVRVSGKVAGQPGDLTNPQLLQFTNSEAQTTVSFKPGETVLLTGLMGTTTGKSNAGLPFLSSLPVIGALFGKQTTSSERSQLLVVLTGDLLK